MTGRGGETGGGEILNNISQAVAPGKERRDISLVKVKGRKNSFVSSAFISSLFSRRVDMNTRLSSFLFSSPKKNYFLLTRNG